VCLRGRGNKCDQFGSRIANEEPPGMEGIELVLWEFVHDMKLTMCAGL